jgi:hypothetical protein
MEGIAMNKTTAEEDLAFIKRVIEDSRTILVENGLSYIIFGGLAIICTFLTYAAAFLKLNVAIPWIWVAFFFLGSLGVLLIERKRWKQTARTFARRIYGWVWIGILIFSAVMTASILMAGIYSIGLMLAVVSGGLGAAYFISSTITRNPWMFGLSFAWWIGSFVLMLPDQYIAPLVFCGFIFVCELVPGIILFLKWKKMNRTRKEGGEAKGQAA